MHTSEPISPPSAIDDLPAEWREERLSYDGERGVYWSQLRPDEAVGTVVVYSVAAVLGSSPLELPPLAEVVDPDALDRLFDGRTVGLGATTSFHYADCTISVEANDAVHVSVKSPAPGSASD